jgi:hypothetical protein
LCPAPTRAASVRTSGFPLRHLCVGEVHLDLSGVRRSAWLLGRSGRRWPTTGSFANASVRWGRPLQLRKGSRTCDPSADVSTSALTGLVSTTAPVFLSCAPGVGPSLSFSARAPRLRRSPEPRLLRTSSGLPGMDLPSSPTQREAAAIASSLASTEPLGMALLGGPARQCVRLVGYREFGARGARLRSLIRFTRE